MDISKTAAFLYCYLKYRLNHFRKRKIDSHQYLIVARGHLGNAIMDIDAILRLREFFAKDPDSKVYLLCSNRIWKLFNLIADMSAFNYIDGGYAETSSGTDFKTVHKVVQSLKKHTFDTIIVTKADNAPLAHYVVATTPANRSIGVFLSTQRQGARWFFERTYTDRLVADMNVHEQQRIKMILNHLGDQDYRVKLYHIEKLCDLSAPEKDYVTISIDSLSPQRRWTNEYFAQLCDSIIEEHGYSICLTGSASARDTFNDIVGRVRNKESVLDYVGKTSTEEWVELIRGAVFHVGVDSGAIHVAASVGTPCFCLTGYWDGKICMPYDLDQVTDGTIKPVCIYRPDAEKLPCYGCKVKYGRFGEKNEECGRRSVNKEPCLCLSEITPAIVENEINAVFAPRKN